MSVVFTVFESHDQWLEARSSKSYGVGASTLARFIATGRVSDNGFVSKQARQAMVFGSLWESRIVDQIASLLQLTRVEDNQGFNKLKSSELSWHDNSFYSTGLFHASIDCLAVINNVRTIIEVKTGSYRNFNSLPSRLRVQYETQSQIERLLSSADQAVIAYVNRPRDWSHKTDEQIASHVREGLMFHHVPLTLTWGDITQYAHTYWGKVDQSADRKAVTRASSDSKLQREADTLFTYMMIAKDSYDQHRKELEELLHAHPQIVAHNGVKRAQLVESTRMVTDYDRLFADYHVDDVDKYRTKTVSSYMSIRSDSSDV